MKLESTVSFDVVVSLHLFLMFIMINLKAKCINNFSAVLTNSISLSLSLSLSHFFLSPHLVVECFFGSSLRHLLTGEYRRPFYTTSKHLKVEYNENFNHLVFFSFKADNLLELYRVVLHANHDK